MEAETVRSASPADHHRVRFLSPTRVCGETAPASGRGNLIQIYGYDAAARRLEMGFHETPGSGGPGLRHLAEHESLVR
jgi:hypothetical protein